MKLHTLSIFNTEFYCMYTYHYQQIKTLNLAIAFMFGSKLKRIDIEDKNQMIVFLSIWQ
jgi:hypothetical protein